MTIDDDRLPWFPCNPSKLLGALAAFKTDAQLVYVTVLLRIYEVRGPCPDTIEALARRTAMNKRRVLVALDALFKAGKLRSVDGGGIMNDYAAEVIRTGAARREQHVRAGSAGGTAAAQNRQRNQSRGGSGAARTLYQEEIELDSLPPVGGSPAAPPKRSKGERKTKLPKDWKPGEHEVAYAHSKGFDDRRIAEMAEAFVDHHVHNANTGTDWSRGWQTWVRNEVKFSRGRVAPVMKAGGGAASLLARMTTNHGGRRDEELDFGRAVPARGQPAP